MIKWLLWLLNAFASFYLFILFYLINQKISIFQFEIIHSFLDRISGSIFGICTDIYIFSINIIIYITFWLLISRLLLLAGTNETVSTTEISPLEPSYIPTYIWFFVIALSLWKELGTAQLFFISLILFYAWWKLWKTAYFNMFLLALWYNFYQAKESITWVEMILISKEKDRKIQYSWADAKWINNFTYLIK